MNFFDHIEDMGLTYREGQANMALDVAEAFRDKQHLIVEASVGIGKSIAYLIPSLIINELTNRPIILATSSIHLSEQLLEDTYAAAKLLGRTVNAVVGKGRSHYSCLNRAVLNTKQRIEPNLEKLHDWVIKNEYGDRGKIDFKVSDNDWNKINVDNCSFERCEHRRDCHFYHMRNAISDVGGQDIIIVNQDLLIEDLLRRQKDNNPLLATRAPLIVIDESHNLESKVRNALTKSWDKRLIENLLTNLNRAMDSLATYPELSICLDKLSNLMNVLYSAVEFQIENLNKEERYNESERLPVSIPPSFNYSLFKRQIDKLSIALIQSRSFHSRSLDELSEQLDSLWELVRDMHDQEESISLIWATTNNRKLEIHYCPKDINLLLQELLFKNNKAKVVMTSATLCQPGTKLHSQYRYIANSTGFMGEYSEPKYADYDYENNTRLYVANDLPVNSLLNETNKKEEYYNKIAARIFKLANITDGRTLILFTAKEDLKSIYPKLKNLNPSWPIFLQQEGPSQMEIVGAFRESQGVLLGTGVFWEGLDIRGDDLSQVIIVRLPFPVPDPIIEYKSGKSSDPLYDVLIPEMIIRLRQGAGRLIRSETDKGVLSILDTRLSNSSRKEYKDIVFESLPIKNRTEHLQEIEDFVRKNILPARKKIAS